MMKKISFSTKLIVTPINKDQSSKSNIDFVEQQNRFHDGQDMMWDDAKNNPTLFPYGLFGFVHNNNHVDIHMITRISESNKRLDSWSSNVGQTDRNVLMLTPKLVTIDWDEWLRLGGPKKIQGSTRIVAAHKKISSHLKNLLKHIRYCEETGETFLKLFKN